MTNNMGALYALPDPPDPPLDLCVQLTIPNHAIYYQLLWSILNNLTYWFAWDRDSAHTGRIVAETWAKIRDSLHVCEGQPIVFGGLQGDDCMCCCLRVENGVLQMLSCGVWTDVPGQPPGGFLGGSQPGAGTPQPAPGGGCQTYHGQVSASGKWYVPTVVSTGDTIEILNMVGAGNDAIGVRWFCPDGSQFFAGACIGATTTDGADPLPSDPHMSLIANVGGTFHVAQGTPLTIPGSVSNAQVYIQVNDGNLLDNAGDYTFDVIVCNNQTAPWSHSENFLTSPGGWGPADFGSGFVVSPWSAGQGFTEAQAAPNVHHYVGAGAEISIAATTITEVDMTYNLTQGASDSTPTQPGIFIVFNSTMVVAAINWNARSNGSGQHLHWSGSQAGVTKIQLFVGASVDDTAYDGGTCAITAMSASGPGTNPF